MTNEILAITSGLVGIGLGFFILVTRMDLISLGTYRFDYVAFYVFLGGGCMLGGMNVIDAEETSFMYLTLIAVTASHLSYQSRLGQRWRPPEHARTDHGEFEDTLKVERANDG